MLFFLCFDQSLFARNRVYKLDLKEGLPDNHVYGCITDRLGYLWMATPKGVVKYNGYSCKTFGMNEGLPIEDTWYLLEDRSGRVWLSNISNETGYIKNDRYYSFIRFENLVYPNGMVRSGDGIVQLNRTYYFTDPKHTWQFIVCDKNKATVIDPGVEAASSIYINNDLEMVFTNKQGYLCRFVIERQEKRVLSKQKINNHIWVNKATTFFGRFLCSYNLRGNFFRVTDVKAKTTNDKKFFLPDREEHISYIYWIDSNFYVISDKSVYVYDESLYLRTSYSIAGLTGGEKKKDHNFCIFNHFAFWGAVLCTTDKGVYINTDHPVHFKRTNIDLQEFRFAGLVRDSFGYWWDNSRHLVHIVKDGVVIQRFRLPGINDLRKVEVYSGDTLMLSCANGVFLLKDRDIVAADGIERLNHHIIKASAVVSGKTIFLVYGGGSTILFKYSLQHSKTIGPAGANSMSYDPVRKGIWLYHNLGITYYDIKADTFRFINHMALLEMGIKNIEAIVIDPVYGNVFLKDFDQIRLLSEDFRSARPLLTRYRYNDAKIMISNNRLVIGGRAGIITLPICGKGKFKAPDIYENTKDHFYTGLSDLQVCGDYALLKTDKGFYRLTLKRQSPPGDAARIIAVYADTTRRLKDKDTLLLPAGTFRISLDLINPNGSGTPVFTYGLGENKRLIRAEGNEIDLHELSSYRWYKLYIKPCDDIWNGETIEVIIRKELFWWQSYYFIAGMILMGIALSALLIVLTRKIVLKKQLQKHLMLELSLDATYAKINPHFVFNSLSVVKHHIKANKAADAARYINHFSRLLRSYLKSSRHRYISIREEVTHLEDYIVLQRERFENSFSYEISIEDAVDQSLEIPALLLQPFVENAIRHGLWHKEGKGHLAISFKTLPGGLCIEIEDDGVGRKRSNELNKGNATESYGNDLSARLVHLFNTYEKIRLKVAYTDKPDAGTIVRITIQYLN